jgi:hypothetical protein
MNATFNWMGTKLNSLKYFALPPIMEICPFGLYTNQPILVK